MGIRKVWAWDKIDWDEEIYLDQVVFHEESVVEMNATELVEVLNLRGVRAHRGLGRKKLRELLLRSLRDEDIEEIVHPLDPLRRRLTWFVETFRDRIKDQLTNDCNERYMELPDAEILITYTSSEKIIKREIERHGYQD